MKYIRNLYRLNISGDALYTIWTKKLILKIGIKATTEKVLSAVLKTN